MPALGPATPPLFNRQSAARIGGPSGKEWSAAPAALPRCRGVCRTRAISRPRFSGLLVSVTTCRTMSSNRVSVTNKCAASEWIRR